MRHTPPRPPDAYPAEGLTVRHNGDDRPATLFLAGRRVGTYSTAHGLQTAIQRYREQAATEARWGRTRHALRALQAERGGTVAVFFDEPTIGQEAHGCSVAFNGHMADFGGTYLGTMPSEHDGQMMHMFSGGYIGTTRQPARTTGAASHGFPVDQTVTVQA